MFIFSLTLHIFIYFFQRDLHSDDSLDHGLDSRIQRLQVLLLFFFNDFTFSYHCIPFSFPSFFVPFKSFPLLFSSFFYSFLLFLFSSALFTSIILLSFHNFKHFSLHYFLEFAYYVAYLFINC